jgi:hypothetical protein
MSFVSSELYQAHLGQLNVRKKKDMCRHLLYTTELTQRKRKIQKTSHRRGGGGIP